eukprot:CAMPEP_0183738590 /NCGR_PEP_ID=MMETSP0737-20130205/54996_1 /TAXON_ID=385413 /ORGANISM="Thalassiosira miniscula, Strain CCMP1093" /LENGTH=56 /DNA_ID=CAMNT_0025973157 /DNA_START=605 /DNA_END=772 /DNA_ORIENTATION=+
MIPWPRPGLSTDMAAKELVVQTPSQTKPNGPKDTAERECDSLDIHWRGRQAQREVA